MFSSIFSSKDNIVSQMLDMAEDAVLTPSEEIKYNLDYLKHYEPFKIAQRYIAFSIIVYSFFIGLLCSYFIINGQDEMSKKLVDLNIKVILENTTVRIILGFYFAGGVINSFRGAK